MNIADIVNRLVNIISYKHPPTFDGELACQCRLLEIPGGIISLLAWLPFIPLDRSLFPQFPQIIYLRLGFSLVGLIVIVFHFLPEWNKNWPGFLKHKSYTLVMLIMTYLALATGYIEGLVETNPAYIGGYCVVLLLFPIAPLRLKHSLILIFLSLFIFFVTGFYYGMNLVPPENKYGMLNLAATLFSTLMGVTVLGILRKHSYQNSRLIQEKKERKLKEFLGEKNLTKREAEVLDLMLQGFSNPEIEQQLYIALSTVKRHVTNIYSKMGVKTRMQLVTMINEIESKW